eukprot:g9356.t1
MSAISWDYVELSDRPRVTTGPRVILLILLALAGGSLHLFAGKKDGASSGGGFGAKPEKKPGPKKLAPEEQFIPKTGMEAVTVDPKLPPLVGALPANYLEKEPCLFAYGPDFDGVPGQKAMVYGVRMSHDNIWAVPTGNPEDKLHGNLLCFPRRQFSQLTDMIDAQIQKGQEEDPKFGIVERGMVKAVQSYGYEKESILYFRPVDIAPEDAEAVKAAKKEAAKPKSEKAGSKHKKASKQGKPADDYEGPTEEFAVFILHEELFALVPKDISTDDRDDYLRSLV